MSDRTTPEFRNPPVVETVLGVQFESLVAMRVVHYGLFWQQLRDRFPIVQEQGTLEPQSEQFDDRAEGPELKWKLMDRPELPRTWYLSAETAAGQQLVQLQPDRMLLNWRRSELANQRYTSYDEVNRPAFEAVIREFVRFVDQHGLGAVRPNQCEVTYVNHVPIDEDCRTPGEMFARCFQGLPALPSDDFLPPSPERARYTCSYRIPENRGRLHVEVRTTRLIKTRQEVLDLRLTARGAPFEPTIDSALAWIDLGHDWVVRGFKSFTRPEMHRRWEIQS